jgi:hypothetical protein
MSGRHSVKLVSGMLLIDSYLAVIDFVLRRRFSLSSCSEDTVRDETDEIVY